MSKRIVPVQKNETVQVTIEDLTHQGAGVARVEGYTLFVANALPGEIVKAKVTKTNKGYGFARLLSIEQKSNERVEPPCAIYDRCGGCQLQHLSYEGQLRAKKKQVRDALERIGGMEHTIVHDPIGMKDPWRYRNKAQVPVGEKDGKVIAGFYAKRSHHIIDTDECLIQHEENDAVVRLVKNIANEYAIPSYDEKRHRGILRHIVARHGKKTNELMVILVTNGNNLPHKEKLVERIRKQLPNVTSIMQNNNPKRTNVIFGEKTITLWGQPYIYDEIGQLTYAISARSFYQVNQPQTEVLYNKVLQYAQLTGNETVIDAYCGIGTISLYLARHAKKVYGVEIVQDAVQDAKRNAKINDIMNAEFVVGEAEKVMPSWYEQGLRPDVIVVDPPRKGCDEQLLQAMVQMNPKRVVYVSCNPATLARDLKILSENGYTTKEVQPVDMFPQTTHVECVALLQREMNTNNINLTFTI